MAKELSLKLTREWTEFSRNPKYRSSKKSLDKLIRLNHYDHLLEMMGVMEENDRSAKVFLQAKAALMGMKDEQYLEKAAVKLNLVEEHTSAWNIVHYHYEKAVKILCMMMVTMMDFIIREQTEISVLCGKSDDSDYFDLLKEMKSLNYVYRREYGLICSFDYCTKKIGQFVDIPEYDDIAREHKRIVINGNPEKVENVIKNGKLLCNKQSAKLFGIIESFYVPEPPYDETLFEECWKEAVSGWDSVEDAFMEFNGLVAKVEEIYFGKMSTSKDRGK